MKNQNSNVLKVILIIAILAIAAYFIYTNLTDRQAGQSGQVNACNFVGCACSITVKDPGRSPTTYNGQLANKCIISTSTGSCTGYQIYCNVGQQGIVANPTGSPSLGGSAVKPSIGNLQFQQVSPSTTTNTTTAPAVTQ